MEVKSIFLLLPLLIAVFSNLLAAATQKRQDLQKGSSMPAVPALDLCDVVHPPAKYYSLFPDR